VSGPPLPRVAAAVLTEAYDRLPGRLGKKLDDVELACWVGERVRG
jgi:hypothetical protein